MSYLALGKRLSINFILHQQWFMHGIRLFLIILAKVGQICQTNPQLLLIYRLKIINIHTG